MDTSIERRRGVQVGGGVNLLRSAKIYGNPIREEIKAKGVNKMRYRQIWGERYRNVWERCLKRNDWVPKYEFSVPSSSKDAENDAKRRHSV
jgi:hypothetical protein